MLRTPARHWMYGFPEAVLEPGEEQTVKVDVDGVFRVEKLSIATFMKEIRGHFRIKRSRLPLLNRDDVVGYSRIHKWSNGKTFKYRPGKTVIEYTGAATGKRFTREYLPSSVLYIHTDASEYVTLLQMWCDKEPMMPMCGDGASALFFGAGVIGNGVHMPATDTFIALRLKNRGDVQVHVHAAVFGIKNEVVK